MDETAVQGGRQKPRKFAAFNAGFGYFLDNIFRFVFSILKFFIKVSGVVFIAFPFVIFGMCIAAPESAVKTLEALTSLLQTIINIFKTVGGK